MKYYEALEIYNDICKKVIESPEEWMQFLDASQGIYKYSFKEQLMIAAQRPDATAVAEIGFWNKKMGRYVKKNSNGIALFTERSDSDYKLRYVYDQSDTELSWYGGREVHPWKVEKKEDYALIVDAIVNATDIEVPNESRIEDVLYYVTATTISDQEDVNELIDSTAFKGSELSKKEKKDQSTCLSALIAASAAYLMIGRCGLNPRDYISKEEFKDISLLSSKSALINFGNIYTDYTQSILQFVEKESNKLAMKHRREEAEKTTETEEVPQAESEINTPVHEPDVEDQKEENSLEEITPGVPIEVEVHGKPDQKQLTLFETLPSIEEQRGTLATEAPKVADISRELIQDALINRVLMSAGGGREANELRLEIAAYWQKGHSINDFAAFLEKEIGMVGQGFQIDGKKLCAWYDSNGLSLSYFPSAIENPMKSLTWREIASRTDRLIRTGSYLSSEEVDAIRAHDLERISTKLYFVFRDDVKDLHKDILDGLDERAGAPECFAYFEKKLDSLEGINQLLDILYKDIEKLNRSDIKPQFRTLYSLESLAKELEDLKKEPKEIPKGEKGSILFEDFITQDEVDYALKQGGYVEGGLKRIYHHFSQHKPDTKADGVFLSKEYGTVGHFGGRTIEAIDYSPSKGIKIAKKLPNGHEIELNIKYQQAAKRIRYLIEHNLFLPPEPQRSVMPAEPTEQQEPAGISDKDLGEHAQPAEPGETSVEVKEERDSSTHPIRRFMRTWGLENCTTPESLETMMQHHQLGKQDLDDRGELSNLMNRARQDYAQTANADVAALSWIKYRNAFRQAFYELADDICQGKATEKVTIGFTEAEIIPEDAEEESATNKAAFSFDQKKENTEESPQETGWAPKPGVSQGGSHDDPRNLEDLPQNGQSDVTPQQGENFIIEPVAGDSRFNPTERIRKNIAAIKMLKQVEAEGRMADDDEKAIINAYVGWGGLADIFDHRKQTWKGEKEALRRMLSLSEYAAAEDSILNAHYTDPGIIAAMYEAVQLFGFSSGNVLEPACGTGRFIGAMPMALRESKVYGVELDELSGRMAKALYPKAEITINGFENAHYPINFFDLAIGNVPFGNYKVADTKYDKLNFQIHDYFIAKTLDLVRPGGVIAFITSKGTMDKQNSSVRQYIARRAELIGAVRLPNNAFSGANTKVTADVLFFQKLESMRDLNDIDWIDLKEDENGLKYNAYFVDHPEYVVGEMVEISGPYGPELACQAAEGSDTIQNVRDVIFDMAVSHRNIYENRIMAEATQDQDIIPATPDVRNFTYTMVNGSIYYRNNSVLIEQEVSGTKAERIEHLIKVRDAVYRLIDAEVSGESPRLIKEYQNELNRIYDHFAKKYGRIGRQANKLAFSEDCTYPMLLSLEVNDSEGNFLRKADIFSKITIRQKQEINHADNPVDALSISLAEKGGVDFEYMQQLTGEDKGTLQSGLKGFIFKNPETKTWESADAYLSGNIRQKLSAAQAAVEKGEKTYLENVEALKKVMPEPLRASEISIVMGSTWVDKKYYEQFLFELLQPATPVKKNIDLFFSEQTGSWQIAGKDRDFSNILSERTYGTKRINAYYLFEACLNLKDVRVYDIVDGKRVVNQNETVLANNKQKEIREAFKNWIFKDVDRREDLVNTYNQLFNNNRPREYDGSNLPCVGLNPDIMLRESQLDVAARIIYGGNTGIFHCVGAGKTLASIVGIMESHRLGLTHKALFVVPNHLIEQWSIEFMRAYPASRILVSTKKDFQPINRKVFCSKIATGNWDAVIIGQSQFEKIPVSFERQERLLNEQIDAIDLEMDFSENNYTKKQLAAARKRVEASLKKLTDQSKKDQVINFEQLGIDALVVDEAQRYKNLFTYSKMGNVAGINQTDSKRASDMLMKCQYMDEITGGQGITFLTGTPVSNAISELHTMMRYLQADLLRELSMESFDSWASVFTEKVTKMELAPQGGNNFRMKSRLGKYNNLPELISFFKNCADIKTPDMLNLPVPMVHFENIVLKPSPAQKALVESLGERADRVHAGAVDRSEDNFLKITSDGRKAALDIRLYDTALPEDEYSKARAIAQNVFKIWSKTDGVQLVFCDLSTPKPDRFNVYDDIKSKLINLGIPEKEIAFIHDAGTDKQKTTLFKKVRKGDVRVLMGSTEKMGAGMNVQDKLIALHHADCPWRPADLERAPVKVA